MAADPSRKFLFDHLPKTGGTAFRIVLESIFGTENVSPWVSGRSELWAAQRFADYAVITGHFHSPIPGVGTVNDRARITLLRDPIDRLVSQYYYYRNDVGRDEWNKLAILAKDHDLYDYARLLEENRDMAISNFYCRRFASQLSRLLWSNRKVLSLAKKAVSRYDFVGIQEQLVDSVDIFCCKFGLPPVAEVPRSNITSSRARLYDLDRRTYDKLVNLNRMDIELYEFALDRFQGEKRKILQNASGFDPVPPLSNAAYAKAAEGEGYTPDSFGDRTVEICNTSIIGLASGDSVVRPGEEMVIRLMLAAHADVSDLTVGIEISDELGEIVFGTNTYLLGQSRSVFSGQSCVITFSFMANMKHGRYFLGAALHTGATHAEQCFHWCDRLATFDVMDETAADFVGYCRLVPTIEWHDAAAVPERHLQTAKASI